MKQDIREEAQMTLETLLERKEEKNYYEVSRTYLLGLTYDAMGNVASATPCFMFVSENGKTIPSKHEADEWLQNH